MDAPDCSVWRATGDWANAIESITSMMVKGRVYVATCLVVTPSSMIAETMMVLVPRVVVVFI